MIIRDIEKGELIFTEQVFSNLKVGLGKVPLTNSKFLKINGLRTVITVNEQKFNS